MNYDRVSMKLRAKEAVHLSRPRPALVMLLFTLITGVVGALSLIPGVLYNPLLKLVRLVMEYSTQASRWGYQVTSEDWASILRFEFPDFVSQLMLWLVLLVGVSVVVSLFRTVMNYGLAGYSLKVYRRQNPSCGEIFSGFRSLGRVLGTGIMVGIFTFLWSLLIILVGGILMGLLSVLAFSVGDGSGSAGGAAILMMGFYLVYFAVLIGVIFIAYRYCLAPYFIMDHPEMGVFQAITASKTTMRGNLGKRFLLDLSFLGWYLLQVGIIYAGMLIGMFIGIAFTDFASLSYYGYGYAYAYDVSEILAPLWPMFAGMIGGAVVAALASLPLSLWLSAYVNTAGAGFYIQITGEETVQPPAYRTNSNYTYTYGGQPNPPVPPAPPAPPVPPVPPAPSAPQVDPGPVPPQSPEPEAPEIPAVPEAPVVPEVPETPAVPEAPVVPEVPETPAVPETPEAPEVPEAPAAPVAQFCANCGAKLGPDARFCPSCGTPRED